jgi:hypothetical protein
VVVALPAVQTKEADSLCVRNKAIQQGVAPGWMARFVLIHLI